MSNYQKLKTTVKRSMDQKLRFRNFDARHGKIGRGAVVKSRKGSSEVTSKFGGGFCYQWKEKASVRRETSAVSGMRAMIAHQNRRRKRSHALSHQWHEEELRRETETSKVEVWLTDYFDNCSDTIRKILVRAHLVSIGTLPNVNCIKTESGFKNRRQVLVSGPKGEEHPSKKNKGRATTFKTETKRQGCCSLRKKTVPQLGCFSHASEPSKLPKSVRNEGPPRHEFLGSIRRLRFTQLSSRQVSVRKYRATEWKNTSQNSSSTKVWRYKNWNTHLKKKMKDMGDTSATKYGTLPLIFTNPNQRIKLHPIRRPMSGLCRPHPPQYFWKKSLG